MSKISLKHSGGNVVSLNSPTNAPGAADVAFKLPNADGSDGQALVTDGSGNLSFANAGSGTATNLIINGQFDVWQRATTSGSTTSSGYKSADRWYLEASGGTYTASQQAFDLGQTDVPSNPKYYLRFNATTANDNMGPTQRIEDVDSVQGQHTLSFWAKGTNPAGGSIQASILQNFGSGGSADVGGQIGAFSLSSSWTKQTFTFTPTSLSGKTIGSGSYFKIAIRQPSADDTTTAWTLDIANVKLEAGSKATDYQRMNPGQELALCQRYFHTLEGDDNDFLAIGLSVNAGNHYMIHHFPQPMRINPSYSSTSTNVDLLAADSSSNINANTLAIVGPVTTPNPTLCWLYGNTSNTATGGQACVWRPNANGLVMSFSAEL